MSTDDRWLDCHEYDLSDGTSFAEPGGRSALRAATKKNPRNRPCPDCGAKNVLTQADVDRGYCCDRCADRNEGSLRSYDQ